MNLSVFGLGYVGCVTAACLARDGHHVIGVDVSDDKVAMLNDGRSPIIEPGLAELIAQVVSEGRLSATAAAAEAVAATDLALIAVGTPSNNHGQPDLDALNRVATAIGEACRDRTRPFTVVIRSTVPPGTGGQMLERLRQAAGPAASLMRLGSNPEFMREGSSIRDFDDPPFVLIGSDDPETAAAIRSIYPDDAQIVESATRNAEMVKYVCNTFHALKVSFANEIATVCEAIDVDAQEVMRIFRRDHKLNVSEAYLTPGFAFGGSCLPKDLRALQSMGRVNALELPLIAGIIPSNQGQIRQAIDAVLETRRRRVGIVGLAFKSTTDDLRESPMVALAETLIGKGLDLKIHDPNVMMARLKGANKRFIEREIPHISSLLCDEVDDLVAHSEVIVLSAKSKDALRAAELARPDQVIIDLTRGAMPFTRAQRADEVICEQALPAAS
jgi:GDP-mannose 6-dehydrogenase